jgi:hypothetical protein
MWLIVRTQIGNRLGVTRLAAQRAVEAAIEGGYLKNTAQRGMPMCLVMGDTPLPNGGTGEAPTVDDLRGI